MITITKATKQPLETDTAWSFDISELEYVLDEHNGEDFLYYKGRLYEKGE